MRTCWHLDGVDVGAVSDVCCWPVGGEVLWIDQTEKKRDRERGWGCVALERERNTDRERERGKHRVRPENQSSTTVTFPDSLQWRWWVKVLMSVSQNGFNEENKTNTGIPFHVWLDSGKQPNLVEPWVGIVPLWFNNSLKKKLCRHPGRYLADSWTSFLQCALSSLQHPKNWK